MTMRRAVFLDRDGVVNRAFVQDGKPTPPTRLDEVRVLPGVREACQALHEAGFVLVLVADQPDAVQQEAAGHDVGAINQLLRRFLRLEDTRVCRRGDSPNCDCREPDAGLLIQAAKDWNIDLQSSYFVGDRCPDVEAAQHAGCRAVFVDYGYQERRPVAPYLEVHSLREAARWIVESARWEPAAYA